jgi:hypothetical protein
MPRLFLFEPGWRIGRKNGSDREFCYTIAPGQDFYHRLLDGEIFIYRADEKVCLPCAARRGLLNTDPKILREPAVDLNLAIDELLNGFDVVLREEGEPSA